MTRRIVIFSGRGGWWRTDEFNGDKAELELFRAGDSCECDWHTIARRFSAAKTLSQFQAVTQWAKRQYHSHLSQRSSVPQLFRSLNSAPDEILIVHEDLGATGIESFVRCPNCGRAYPVKYKLNGTMESPAYACLSCGSLLNLIEPMPTLGQWEEALKIYRDPPATYCVLKDSNAIRDPIAKAHAGCPVKVRKIARYDAGCSEMIFEVLFRDWKTAFVKVSELERFSEEDEQPMSKQEE